MSNQPTSKKTAPRLIHTPSLPNIWFPPHSGPIPKEMKELDPILLRSSLPEPTTPSSKQLLQSTKSDTRRHVKYASLDPGHSHDQPTKSHHRRRTDHIHTHSLITPPLTPSSSIRTNASDAAIEICDSQQVEPNAGEPQKEDDDKLSAPTLVTEEVLDDDPSASRIILFEGMKKTVEPPILEAAICEALATAAAKAKANGTVLALPSLKREELVTKGMNKRDLATGGRVPVIFYDLRIAKVVNDIVRNGTDGLNEALAGEGGLKASMVSIGELAKTFGASPLLNSADGSFFLRVQNSTQRQEQDPLNKTFHEPMNNFRNSIKSAVLSDLLKSFGRVRYFVFKRQEPNGLVYQLEYHNTRDADIAYAELRSKEFLGIKINVFGKVEARQPIADTVEFPNISSPTEGDNHVSEPPAGTKPGGHAGQLVYTTESYLRPRHEENYHYSHEQGVNLRLDVSSACYSPDGICGYCPSKVNPPLFANPYPHYSASPTPSPQAYHLTPMQSVVQTMVLTPHPAFASPAGFEYVDTRTQAPPPWAFGYDPTTVSTSPPLGVNSPMGMSNPNAAYHLRDESTVPTSGGYQKYQQTETPITHTHSQAGGSRAPGLLETPRPSSSPPTSRQAIDYFEPSAPAHPFVAGGPSNDRNQLDIARIEEGIDTRTTVMIKNIPNKMSDKDLTEYINAVCPKRVDFLYLRMDFTNGCNVGYAFVNFIRVEDLLHFAKARLGVKWNMFSSEKVLQMSYANYQGKEALVEKFKNSAIMDEREAWRPRIFYSSGPDEGLVEPFPAPTHMRRKERSSYNRGALFVPGIGNDGGLHHSRNSLHRRYLEDSRGNRSGFGHLGSRQVEGGVMGSSDVFGRRVTPPKAR